MINRIAGNRKELKEHPLYRGCSFVFITDVIEYRLKENAPE
jgi:hypothetical protein